MTPLNRVSQAARLCQEREKLDEQKQRNQILPDLQNERAESKAFWITDEELLSYTPKNK